MNKIMSLIFVLVLFCVQSVFADVDTLKTAGAITYWTEGVVGASNDLSQDGYVYGTTTLSDTLKTTGATLISPVLGERSSTDFGARKNVNKAHARNKFSGTKFMVGVNVGTAYADVAATLIVEGSGDGTTWATAATASADTEPNVTGVKWYLVDLTSVYLPYYRLIFNKGALTVNRAGKIKFLYALPQ